MRDSGRNNLKIQLLKKLENFRSALTFREDRNQYLSTIAFHIALSLTRLFLKSTGIIGTIFNAQFKDFV